MSSIFQLPTLKESLPSSCEVLTDPQQPDFQVYLKRWSDVDRKTPGAIILPTSEADIQHVVRPPRKDN